VLGIAPLIMVTLPTVSSFFLLLWVCWQGLDVLLHLWLLPSSWVIILGNGPPISSLWTTSRANGSLPANGSASTCLGLTHPHTQETGDRTASGMGQVGQPGPTDPGPFQPGSVASLRTWVLLSLCTLPPPFAPFLTMSFSCLWWRVFSLEVWSFTLQSFGMSLCNTSVLATFGCDFMKLSNMNETPQLLLWTCYDSVLYVHVFLQKRNTSKYTYKDELVISLLCLVAGQFHNKIQTKV
jgi:hypothetical protein